MKSINLLILLGALATGNALRAQTYQAVYPPNTEFMKYPTCVDDSTWPWRTIYNCAISVQLGFYSFTNGHLHDTPAANHTRSTVQCTDPYTYVCSNQAATYAVNVNTSIYGSVPIKVKTSLIGQGETFYTQAPSIGSYRYWDFLVGYLDTYYNHHPEVWVKIGGTDTGVQTYHGNTDYNRYMASAPAYGVYNATLLYLQNRPGIKICMNDMALPVGGKFDYCAVAGVGGCNNGPQPWTSPHQFHDRGTAVDVAAAGTAQCTNYGGTGVNIAEFINACIANGAVSGSSYSEGNHAHCGFWSNASFPH